MHSKTSDNFSEMYTDLLVNCDFMRYISGGNTVRNVFKLKFCIYAMRTRLSKKCRVLRLRHAHLIEQEMPRPALSVRNMWNMTTNRYVKQNSQWWIDTKNAVFWDVATCRSCKTDVSVQSIVSIIRVKITSGIETTLAVYFSCYLTVNFVPSSPILSTLITEAMRSSETPVLTRVTQRNIPEDGILHSHHSENLKSYIALTGWT
jgi:hypothetical protein